MRNIEDLIIFTKDYFKLKGNSSGLNSFLSLEEQKYLLEYFNCKRLNECMHIIMYGYIGICKICQKRTTYIDITKLYRTYCSKECSFKDKEICKERSLKSIRTKKEKNIKPIIKKIEIKCLECSIPIIIAKNKLKIHHYYCNNHKKKCKNCGIRHNKAGVSCSIECSNNLKKITNIKNSGVTHNLLRSGSRPNQLEFYLKKGLDYKQANKLLSEFQLNANIAGNTIEYRIKRGGIYDINEYILKLKDKIDNLKDKKLYKPYDLIYLVCNKSFIEKYGYKYIYDKLYKLDKNIFNYEQVKFRKTKYGNQTYTKNKEILRSKLEYDFYCLLENNGIENYKVGKNYPNSKYKYDFYLEDYDIYIEIAGMMYNDEYKNKMNDKKLKFKNLVILETYKDMIEFIQKIKKN